MEKSDRWSVNPAPSINEENKIKGNQEACFEIRLMKREVRTMTTGLTRDLREVDDARKSAVINNELLRLGVDIAAL